MPNKKRVHKHTHGFKLYHILDKETVRKLQQLKGA